MRTDLANLISSAARGVYRRYRAWCEEEDIRQEMWAWALRQPTYVDNIGVNTLKRRLYGAGEVYARREKATKSGYSPDDEQFYSLAVIRELLPQVVDSEPPTMRGVDDRDSRSARRSASGPGMELETVLADLRKAYSGLGPLDQAVLLVAAGAQGHPDPPTADEVNVILRRMQRALGGRKPKREAA